MHPFISIFVDTICVRDSRPELGFAIAFFAKPVVHAAAVIGNRGAAGALQHIISRCRRFDAIPARIKHPLTAQRFGYRIVLFNTAPDKNLQKRQKSEASKTIDFEGHKRFWMFSN
jgi:hypothetical protein